MTSDKQSKVSSFLEITAVQSSDIGQQFLQATGWNLEEAIQLFFAGNEAGVSAPASLNPREEEAKMQTGQTSGELEDIGKSGGQIDGSDEVRAPLPVKREILYDDALLYRAMRMGHPPTDPRMGHPPTDPSSLVAFRNFNQEMKHSGVWEAEETAASSAETSRDNLASLYRPPFALMHQGPFEKAKQTAAGQDKWLIVNLQSTTEFSSHMLNRDTWANEAVAQTISTNFIFWQVYDDTTEGRKVCTYYKLEKIPVVLVIDPITGQKMRSWNGMVHPESLLEDLLPYMDNGPNTHHASLPHKRLREVSAHNFQDATGEDEELRAALAASLESTNPTVDPTSADKDASQIEAPEPCPKMPGYPPLPEEPNVDKSLLCKVGVRLPDGRRLQRSFLRTDPIQLLWSFCSSQLGEAQLQPFRLTTNIPGSSKSLDYESQVTFEQSGLANSMISVTWE